MLIGNRSLYLTGLTSSVLTTLLTKSFISSLNLQAQCSMQKRLSNSGSRTGARANGGNGNGFWVRHPLPSQNQHSLDRMKDYVEHGTSFNKIVNRPTPISKPKSKQLMPSKLPSFLFRPFPCSSLLPHLLLFPAFLFSLFFTSSTVEPQTPALYIKHASRSI